MMLLLTYLLLALSISFICSVTEAVILSVSIPFVELKALEKKRGARLLKKFKNNIDLALSSILTLNTIAHTVGAAGVGAQATMLFGEAYFGVISAILTLLILLLSEILPKSIGARYWRSLALPAAQIINVMVYVSYPVVLFSKLITKIISGGKDVPKVSREEIAALTEIGKNEGVFDESESKIIGNLINMQSVAVRDVMTPRTVVFLTSEETTLAEVVQQKDILKYSRIPVYKGNTDNVTGYVLKFDILEKLAASKENEQLQLKDIRRPIVICYEGTSVPKLFEMLLEKKEQIALVVDEYGGMDGIATLEDVIETILGMEIIDERDGQIDMQELAKERWRLRAKRLNIDLPEEKM
ncbi:MAG: CNNM domain-containing protein [Prevotellaceae bacterium]|jgi:CBS domain containing-hemolysin-like protein|nr:CNNM domain-containing protein [Prevotellaceae bacterium]